MTEIEEAKRRKKRKNKIKVTYTTGDPKLNIKHFNKMMGTDFNNPSTEEAKAAAKGANANMGIESNGSSGNADVGEIVGGTNDAGTDFGGDCGGEGMGESLNLHEAKREVRRYFIRPQHIFCANKAEVIKALIDIGEQNCSVYTLKYLGDEKDITKLTNKDIIYYYDDGILYDKNHVKVMDYDLYIKHEEERKKFSQPADEIPAKEFDKEYDDRITHRTEFEESLGQKKPIEQLLLDLTNKYDLSSSNGTFTLGITEDTFDFSIDSEYVWGIEYSAEYYSEEDKYLIYADYLARHGGSEPADLEDEDKNEDTEYWDCYKVFKGSLSFLQWLQKLITDSDFYVGSDLEAYDLTQLPDFIKKLAQNNTIITKKAEVIDDPQIEFKESLADDQIDPLSKMLPDLKELMIDNMGYLYLGTILFGYGDATIGLDWDNSKKQYLMATSGINFSMEDNDTEASDTDDDPNADKIIDMLNNYYDNLTDVVTTLRKVDKLVTKWDIDWFYKIYDNIPEDIFNKEQIENLTEELNPFEQDFPRINAFGEDLDHPKHVCCICGEEFEGYGNNPAPVKNDGVCCDACNLKFVIPARLDQANAEEDDLNK